MHIPIRCGAFLFNTRFHCLLRLCLFSFSASICVCVLKSAPKLKLGYLGVVNRSQKDIIDSKSMAEARAKEAAFFQVCV
jgi:hypothetical protein